MKKKWLLIASLFSIFLLNAQQELSSEAIISALTVGPGTSLNDSFGHSAFRIRDEKNNIDLVFNYGVYDFQTPNFYIKFARGKLNYLMGLNYFDDFFMSYMAQNRTVKEQVLNLSQKQKQDIFDYLLNNYKPENRAYLYDFFYDNCATRIRDVLEKVMKNNLTFNKPEKLEEETFRQLIQENLNKNSWGSVGIDLALGSVIDRKATAYEHMFLPKFIFLFFENATINNSNTPLVKHTNVLYKKEEGKQSIAVLTSPLMIFSILGLLIGLITYSDYKKNKRTVWLDAMLFGITGIIGVLILLLWFATDHESTAQNYNLLWACALNILAIPQILKKVPNKWISKYLKFLVILLLLLTLHWIIGIQVFAITLIPLLLALIVRYIFLIYLFKKT